MKLLQYTVHGYLWDVHRTEMFAPRLKSKLFGNQDLLFIKRDGKEWEGLSVKGNAILSE